MGNSYSDIKSTFSQKEKVPKHLKPMNSKKKKKKQQKSIKEKEAAAKKKNNASSPAEPAAPAKNNNNTSRELFVIHSQGGDNKMIENQEYPRKKKTPRTMPSPPIIALTPPAKPFMYGDDADFVEEDTVLVGSGPRGAFRWFKGRRYLNYATKGGLDNTLLPNDQIELDRMRVLSFIIRWAFKGNVIAPVEDNMKNGIKALNVAFGPGMWTGHHTIDMAMDYPNSQFTAVDVCDLLPKDFEQEAAKSFSPAYVTVMQQQNNSNGKKEEEGEGKRADNAAPTITTTTASPTSNGATTAPTTAAKNAAPNTEVNNMTLFTPMHPNLSTRLQNTTTPVIDSSTLDSTTGSSFAFSSSQIEEVKTHDSKLMMNSTASATTTMTTMTTTTMGDSDDEEDQDEDDDEESTAAVSTKSQFEADPAYIKNMEAPGQTNVTPVMKHRNLLPNLEFFQLNVIDAKLPFPDNTFDFVKQHLATASFTVANWKRVISELYRVTKPGGYIQLLEIDYNTFNLGPNGRKWEIHLLETARLKRQMEPRIARNLPDILKAIGMIDVSSKLVSIPLGSWGLDLGNLWKHNMEMFVEATSPLLSKLAGVSPSDYKQQWKVLLEEVKDKRAFTNIHAAWGKKPLEGPSNLDNITIDWSSVPPML